MISTKVFSSLVKVFSDEEPIAKQVVGHSVLNNEKTSFQIALSCDTAKELTFSVVSQLGPYLKYFHVLEIPSSSDVHKNQDDYILRSKASLYPDLLSNAGGRMTLEPNKWRSLWVELSSDTILKPGTYPINVSFFERNVVVAQVVYNIEIIAASLPPQSLIYTNWFHTDCLCDYYKISVFSPEYWKTVENYLKMAKEYGMNMVLTPLFTPPLDTKVGGERLTVQLVDVVLTKGKYSFNFDKLTQWTKMCDRVGIKYLEMSHLFTQWGAKHAPKIMASVNGKPKKIFGWLTRATGRRYTSFLDQFGIALNRYISEHNIKDRCFFHVSDEPARIYLKQYKKVAATVERNFGIYPIIDALSEYAFYKTGAVKLPIPANDAIEPFVGNVPELWTYYCCAQHKNYVSNRFFCMPSQRNRILGYQAYKYNIKGFLHWGYNYYYTQYSAKQADPYLVTDAGGAFSAGDSFIVYPGKNNKPLASLRLKVFFDGLQDMRALQLLESLIGKSATLTILEEGNNNITFSQYPHSDDWHLATRERINQAIKDNLSKS